MTEEREVRARLKIQKEGDEAAFREVGDDLEDLKSDIEKLRTEAGKLRESFDDPVRADENIKRINSLDDLLEELPSKMALVAGKALAIGAAFDVGWQAGGRLRDTLNELTGGSFDRYIQQSSAVVALTERLAGAQGDLAGETQRLQNLQEVLVKNGLDPTGLSLEEVEEKFAELVKSQKAAKKETKEGQEAYESFLKSLGLLRGELDQGAAALANNIEQFKAANSELSNQQFAAIFGKQIQAVLEQYELLGVFPPLELAKIAEAWGVTTTAAEQASAKHEALVAKLRQEIAGAAETTKAEVADLLRALPEALEGVDLKNIKLLQPEQYESAKMAIQGLVDGARETGIVFPAELAEAATSLGIFVRGVDVAGGRLDTFGSEIGTLGDDIKKSVAGAQGFEAPIVGGLDLIIRKAAEAKAAVDQLGNVGVGGGGEG